MKDIKITSDEVQRIIQDQLPKIIAEAFDGYNSPINKAVEESVKEQEGAIKKMVNETLKNILKEPDFRTQLGERILEKVLTDGMKR